MVEEEMSRVPLSIQCARIATPVLLILTVWQISRFPGSGQGRSKLMVIASLLFFAMAAYHLKMILWIRAGDQ